MAIKKYVINRKDGLTVCAYPGDGTVLLAFDLEQANTANFAGFAIRCTPKGGNAYYIPNQLNFSQKVTADTAPEQRTGTPSNQAPIQKFRWTHVLNDSEKTPIKYAVTAMYFTGSGNSNLRNGATCEVEVDTLKIPYNSFQIGFTRGYLSSQAYADRFHNAPFRPAQKSINFNTSPYQKQYEWLGFDARKLIFNFLNEAINDKSITLDLLAFDLDEPDFINGLTKLGGRLRAFLDNSKIHTQPGAMEIQAKAALEKSAGAQNVKGGCFQRFAHCKVMIQRRNGKAVKVLTGSANFSIRGLYVQANNVLVYNDAGTAALYARMFDETFANMSGFKSSSIAAGYNNLAGSNIPMTSVAFSPHKTASVSLDKVATAIQNAKSSVLFAVMQLGGGGSVMEALRNLPKSKIFSYGVTQTEQGLNLYKPGQSNGVLVPFGFLGKQVPVPFKEEWNGGMGQVIHHKFVVIDYNGDNPIVFTGSSNLAAGGEEANGDNLIAITDRDVAYAYGVEAIRLVDHYHFRAVMKDATNSNPMTLQNGNWFQAYYNVNDIKCTERLLFAGGQAELASNNRTSVVRTVTSGPIMGKVLPFPTQKGASAAKKKPATKKAAPKKTKPAKKSARKTKRAA